MRGVLANDVRMDEPTLHRDHVSCTGTKTKTRREEADVFVNGDIRMVLGRSRSSRALVANSDHSRTQGIITWMNLRSAQSDRPPGRDPKIA